MVGIDDGDEDLILMRCVTAVIAVSFVLTSLLVTAGLIVVLRKRRRKKKNEKGPNAKETKLVVRSLPSLHPSLPIFPPLLPRL